MEMHDNGMQMILLISMGYIVVIKTIDYRPSSAIVTCW